jgi:hypothetical protein
MAEIRPLPIYPSAPTGDELTALKTAKDMLNLPFLVKPMDAVPGSPGRILALGKRPDFLCDHALVAKPTVESIKSALEWVLGEHEDKRATTMAQMLQEIFKGEVKELAVPKN